jgi:DNA damage-inducible protein 1
LDYFYLNKYAFFVISVLMLYINCTVKDKPLQVFVDSGAQTTIMSSACADRLGLLHLVDDRFEGTAVGGKKLNLFHYELVTLMPHN